MVRVFARSSREPRDHHLMEKLMSQPKESRQLSLTDDIKLTAKELEQQEKKMKDRAERVRRRVAMNQSFVPGASQAHPADKGKTPNVR
jgi:hypothetical protein